MDGAYHFRQSERLLWLAGPDSTYRTDNRDELAALIWMAQVHAQLAQAAAMVEAGSPGTSVRWRNALAARTGAPLNGEADIKADVPTAPANEAPGRGKVKTPRRRGEAKG